jgi:hypothetical protein
MIHDHALMIHYALVGFISHNFFKHFYKFLLSSSSLREVYTILEIFLYDEIKITVMHRFREYVQNAGDLFNLKELSEFYNS